MWDDELEGKDCFVADNIDDLIFAVRNDGKCGVKTNVLHSSFRASLPFLDSILNNCYPFAYYDPNYEVKRAYYKEGKKVQILSSDGADWRDVEDEGMFEWYIKQGRIFRIKPEKTVDLGPYFKPKKWTKFNLNHHVKVKLNETGERLYLEHFTSTCLPLSSMKKPGEDGYMTFQMHEFMGLFGSHFGPCLQDTPCCMDVLVEAEE